MAYITRFCIFTAFYSLGALITKAQTLMSNWPEPNDIVGAIAYDPASDLVFFSGSFTSVDGQPRDGLAAFFASTGILTDWAPTFGIGGVSTMSVVGNRLYVGGTFDQVNSMTRNHAASFDIPSGTLNNWNPNISGNVWDMDANSSTIYLGGDFYSAQGQVREKFAAVNAANNGSPTAFEVGYCDDYGYAVAVSGNTVYCGGEFYYMGGATRPNISAVNATTGDITSWNPGADGWVMDLAVSGNTVYAAGNFSECGGAFRTGVAAIDATTGLATAWNAQTFDHVNAVATNGSTVYVGGPFTTIGGQPRNGFAALSATTAQALPWDPQIEYGPNELFIGAIVVHPPYLFVGGEFTSVGGNPRGYLAGFSGIASAVEEIGEVEMLPASPNPCEGLLMLNYVHPEAQKIQVVNVLGELVQTFPFTPQLDMSDLSAGSYFITVQDKHNNALARTRVVRQ